MVEMLRRDPTTALLSTIDHAYAAVLEPSRWTDALSDLASMLDARAAGLRVETTGVKVEQCWVGLDADFNRKYIEQYWRHDPWAEPARSAEAGYAGHGDAIVPRDVVEKSAFHNELALPNGFDDLAGGVLERSAHRLVSVGVMKGAGTRRFGGDTDLVLDRVMPHFRRALMLHERLTGTSAAFDASLDGRIEQLLQERYRLTPAEIRVAMRVGRGLSPKDAARELDVSWYTIRAQLQQVYAKTETGSQRALARLVTLTEASLAAALGTSRR
jgi:DNA-binding CsgD family transcriptional regulator